MTTDLTGPNSTPGGTQGNGCGDEAYDDEITPEILASMNEVVSDDDFVGYEVVDGPAW